MWHKMKKALATGLLLSCLIFSPKEGLAQAFPINSDVALQPAEGQWIYRTQLRWRRVHINATVPVSDTDIDLLINSHVMVYGWTDRLSTVVGVPLIYRNADTPMGDEHDLGVGDIRTLARYQIWKKLG